MWDQKILRILVKLIEKVTLSEQEGRNQSGSERGKNQTLQVLRG